MRISACCLFLCLWYPKCDLAAIGSSDKRAFLFGCCETGKDVAKGYTVRSFYQLTSGICGSLDLRVCAYTERGTPFFGDYFRKACHSCFCQTVIGLTSIAIDATSATDVDDVPWLSVLDSEIWRGGSNELEGCGIVEGNNRVPLLVCHLRSTNSAMAGLISPAHVRANKTHTLCITPSHVKPALLTMI